VRWSQRARADLRAIHDHIARESPQNAKAVVQEIHARAATLFATPRIGRMVPELNDPALREMPVHSWRVIYQVRDSTLYIVTLIHKRRAPAPEEFRPA
jgi:plasmid stabilization system protein ParE